MNEPFVVVIGVYPEVVRQLAQALEEAGYAVRTLIAHQAAEAEDLAARAAAIITSPFLPAQVRLRLAATARRGAAKVVMLHAGEISGTELADAVVSAVPTSVVEALRTLLPKQSWSL